MAQDVSRRTIMAAAAAVPLATAAATALPRPVLAAAPAPEAQAPGFYRFKVGSFVVTTVNDGQFARPNPAEGFVRNASPEAVRAALEEAMMPTDALTIPINFTVVHAGGRVILFDSGTGGQLAPSAANGARNLQAAGIDPASVDLIVFSHFHGDHIAGLTTREGQAIYPNAEIAVPEAEWAHWMDDGVMSRAPENARGGFQLARAKFGPYASRVRRYGDGAELAPGIRAISAHGHTPGHTVFHVADGNQQLLVLCDTTNHPALFVRNPTWAAVFDMDADMAAQSRRRILDRAAADRAMVIGYHFPFPAAGRIRARGDGFDFVPAPWSSAL
jgi:glyoxylase-like metal-dependent hydrolase (beta-lactamase superfamily II)